MPEIALDAERLAIQVILLEHVTVYDDQPSDPHTRQAFDDPATKAAGSDDANRRLQEGDLSLPANRSQVARIASRQQLLSQGSNLHFTPRKAHFIGNLLYTCRGYHQEPLPA